MPGSPHWAKPAWYRLASLRQKARYVAGLARQLESGAVSLERIARLPDDAAREALIQIPGVRPVDGRRLPAHGLAPTRRLAARRPGAAQVAGRSARTQDRAAERAGCGVRTALEPLARGGGATAVACLPVTARKDMGPPAAGHAQIRQCRLRLAGKNAFSDHRPGAYPSPLGSRTAGTGRAHRRDSRTGVRRVRRPPSIHGSAAGDRPRQNAGSRARHRST